MRSTSTHCSSLPGWGMSPDGVTDWPKHPRIHHAPVPCKASQHELPRLLQIRVPSCLADPLFPDARQCCLSAEFGRRVGRTPHALLSFAPVGSMESFRTWPRVLRGRSWRKDCVRFWLSCDPTNNGEQLHQAVRHVLEDYWLSLISVDRLWSFCSRAPAIGRLQKCAA